MQFSGILKPDLEFTSKDTNKPVFRLRMKKGYCLFEILYENMSKNDKKIMNSKFEQIQKLARDMRVILVDIKEVGKEFNKIVEEFQINSEKAAKILERQEFRINVKDYTTGEIKELTIETSLIKTKEMDESFKLKIKE